MTDITQVDPVHAAESHQPADEIEAKSTDTASILLLVLSLLLLITAVAGGLYALLLRIFPTTNIPLHEVLAAIDWPIGLETRHVLGVGLLLPAILLYIAAIFRLTHDKSLQARAGCPSCQNHELLRISRTNRDRLITLSGVRVARYQCRNCTWYGRRVFKILYHPLDRAPISNELIVIDAEEAPPLHPAFKTIPSAPPEKTTAATALPEEKSSSRPPQDPSQNTTFPSDNLPSFDASDNDTAIPAEVVTETANITLSSQRSKENARPNETTTRAKNSVLDQKQARLSGSKAIIATKFGVNLKAEPDPTARWVGLLGPETIVSLQNNLEQNDGTIWYYVSAGEQIGWVTGSFLETIE